MADDQIVLCFDCGTKNRIPLGVGGISKMRELWRRPSSSASRWALDFTPNAKVEPSIGP